MIEAHIAVFENLEGIEEQEEPTTLYTLTRMVSTSGVPRPGDRVEVRPDWYREVHSVLWPNGSPPKVWLIASCHHCEAEELKAMEEHGWERIE